MKNNLLASLFLLVSIKLFTQTFRETFSMPSDAFGNFVGQTNDNGYILAGYTMLGWSEIYLLKTDPYGILQWAKTYGDGNGSDSFVTNSVFQTNDNGYIIGASWGDPLPKQHGILIKTDSIGNLSWSKVIDAALPASNSSISFAKPTIDNGYILTGYSYVNGYDLFLIKTDSTGNLQWTKTFGNTFDEEWGISILQNADKGFTVFGNSSLSGAYLIKTDSIGNSLWSKTYGGSVVVAYDFKETFEGGYIICGGYYVNAVLPFLIKTDSDGNVQWTKSYGGTTNYGCALSVYQTSDSGFAVACTTGTVFKTDVNGNFLWGKMLHDTITSPGYLPDTKCVIENNNKELVISGTFYNPSTPSQVYLINTDSNGNSNCLDSSVTLPVSNVNTITGAYGVLNSAGTQLAKNIIVNTPAITANNLCIPTGLSVEENKNSIATIYPNPATNELYVELFSSDKGVLILYSSLGEKISSFDLINGRNKINLEKINSGLYFYTLSSDEGILVHEKLIVLK